MPTLIMDTSLNDELKLKVEARWGKQDEDKQGEKVSLLELKTLVLEKITEIENNAIDMEKFLIDEEYQETYSHFIKKQVKRLYFLLRQIEPKLIFLKYMQAQSLEETNPLLIYRKLMVFLIPEMKSFLDEKPDKNTVFSILNKINKLSIDEHLIETKPYYLEMVSVSFSAYVDALSFYCELLRFEEILDFIQGFPLEDNLFYSLIFVKHTIVPEFVLALDIREKRTDRLMYLIDKTLSFTYDKEMYMTNHRYKEEVNSKFFALLDSIIGLGLTIEMPQLIRLANDRANGKGIEKLTASLQQIKSMIFKK